MLNDLIRSMPSILYIYIYIFFNIFLIYIYKSELTLSWPHSFLETCIKWKRQEIHSEIEVIGTLCSHRDVDCAIIALILFQFRVDALFVFCCFKLTFVCFVGGTSY